VYPPLHRVVIGQAGRTPQGEARRDLLRLLRPTVGRTAVVLESGGAEGLGHRPRHTTASSSGSVVIFTHPSVLSSIGGSGKSCSGQQCTFCEADQGPG